MNFLHCNTNDQMKKKILFFYRYKILFIRETEIISIHLNKQNIDHFKIMI